MLLMRVAAGTRWILKQAVQTGCLSLVSVAVDVDPDRLHQVALTLVNQTRCVEQWGGGLIQESHICSHPAGSSSCMVTPAYHSL